MKSLKLTKLAERQLSEQEMNFFHGGQATPMSYYITVKPSVSYVCGCACKYADNGGSSTDANGMANSNTGLMSR